MKELNKRQKIVLKLMKDGNNVLLGGFQETGKSTIIKHFLNWCIKNNYNIIEKLDSKYIKNKKNIIIFDDIEYFDKDLLDFLMKNKNKVQYVMCNKSHFNYGNFIPIFKSVPYNNKNKLIKKIFEYQIYWRRPIPQDGLYSLDFSETGSNSS